jgi:hypothetical protein
MRLVLFALAFALVSLGGTPQADARPFWEESDRTQRSITTNRRKPVHTARTSGGRYNAGPRPGRWCGWWMRTQLGGGPEYNLARNWRKWGRPAGGPQIGAVVVWSGHVGMITGRAANGQWIVKSGNDGGRVRERARSVAGATFRVG